MNYVHVIAVLATIQFFVFSFLTGRARARSGLKAPAMVGDEHFERAYMADPTTRGLGFLLTVIPTFSLLIAALAGALMGVTVH